MLDRAKRSRRAAQTAGALLRAAWLIAPSSAARSAGQEFSQQLARVQALIDAGQYRDAEPLASALVSAAEARDADNAGAAAWR